MLKSIIGKNLSTIDWGPSIDIRDVCSYVSVKIAYISLQKLNLQGFYVFNFKVFSASGVLHPPDPLPVCPPSPQQSVPLPQKSSYASLNIFNNV